MKFWLQFLWLLPSTILIWLFYILPFWALGYIELYILGSTYGGPFAIFATSNENSWYTRLWKRWWGWSGPMVMIISHDLTSKNMLTQYRRTVMHEGEHCRQHLRWGIFFYPVYFLNSLWIYFFQKNKHPYLDNSFEMAARKAAGQQEFFTSNQWPDKKRSKWPWW